MPFISCCSGAFYQQNQIVFEFHVSLSNFCGLLIIISQRIKKGIFVPAFQTLKLFTMKNVLKILFLLSFSAIVQSNLFAQGMGGNREMDPAKRAEQQTANMKEVLALSDAQVVKVQEINLKYSKIRQEAFNANQGGDFTAMREKMNQMQEEQNKEFKGVMTAEQYDKWTKYQEEQRKLREQRRREGGN
jgi:periplasmic protein CpxP/Spy